MNTDYKIEAITILLKEDKISQWKKSFRRNSR